MRRTRGALLLVTILAVAGCANTGSFDNDKSTTTAPIATGPVAGSASDPTSPLYFQETIGDRVLFDVDQSSLNVSGKAVLDGQARWLNSNTDYNAVIEGHADEQGTRAYNLALGARRADAARNYLVSKGIPSTRLKVLSFGKERPIEICSQESCYALNRRSVTILSSGLNS